MDLGRRGQGRRYHRSSRYDTTQRNTKTRCWMDGPGGASNSIGEQSKGGSERSTYILNITSSELGAWISEARHAYDARSDDSAPSSRPRRRRTRALTVTIGQRAMDDGRWMLTWALRILNARENSAPALSARRPHPHPHRHRQQIHLQIDKGTPCAGNATGSSPLIDE